MAQYQLFVLPVIALALVIFRNPFDRDVTLSNSWRSRRRRRVLLTRLTVIVLLLATVISEIWQFGDLNSLTQSVIISALILLPAFAAHWGFLLKQAIDGEKIPAMRWENEPSDDEPDDVVQTFVTSRRVASEQQNRSEHKIATKQTPDSEYKNDPKDGVEKQLERVSDLIECHDLDEPIFSFSDEDADLKQQIKAKHDEQLASNSALITSSGHSTDLATLETPQILQLVLTLRKDKKRLQKLVIAQQASIQSEQAAHRQTRVLTRDAITVMRSARTAQKHAEKLARRERSERKRLEQQYTKVAHDLSNAMSIIKMRKSARVAGEISPKARNGKLPDGVLK